jgi:hypothetical protein
MKFEDRSAIFIFSDGNLPASPTQTFISSTPAERSFSQDPLDVLDFFSRHSKMVLTG